MKQTVKKLNWFYYGIMALTVLAAGVAYLLIVKQVVAPIDPLSHLGHILQYIIILDALLTIPLGLWLHKRQCTKIAKIEDKTAQEQAYYKSALCRIIMVSNTMLFAFPAYYLFGAYMSMLWIAAIAAIGWYFTKPTERKMELELTPQEEQY